MTMRRMLLGAAAMVAMGASATARPPAALSEGREVDPVVRDFQLPEPPAAPNRAGLPRAAEVPCDDGLGELLLALGDSVLSGLTIPLGTVSPIET